VPLGENFSSDWGNRWITCAVKTRHKCKEVTSRRTVFSPTEVLGYSTCENLFHTSILAHPRWSEGADGKTLRRLISQGNFRCALGGRPSRLASCRGIWLAVLLQRRMAKRPRRKNQSTVSENTSQTVRRDRAGWKRYLVIAATVTIAFIAPVGFVLSLETVRATTSSDSSVPALNASAALAAPATRAPEAVATYFSHLPEGTASYFLHLPEGAGLLGIGTVLIAVAAAMRRTM
jgi:hypothetical protein